MTADRPVFVDPAPELSGAEVGEAPAPRWFLLLALVLLAAAAAYLLTQLSGPKLAWPHDFVSGRDAAESTGSPGGGAH